MKTRRQQFAARCCSVKPNECRNNSKAPSKNVPGLTIRADGKRTALYESTWYDLNEDGIQTANELKANNYSWSYDDAGRLTDEALDHWDDNFDQTESFTFDLTGNRTRLERDHANDAAIDEVITYEFDANDRLTHELLDSNNNGTTDQTTTYAYDHTQQTSKTVTAASQTVSKQVFGYNLQGRMSSVVNEGYTSGTLSSRERTSYSYDSKSFRVELVTETGTATGTIANETWTLESSTSFLADAHNHTGYTQTIREVKTNADGTTETRDYTFGHDEIAQRTVTRDDQGQVTNDQTLVFGHDGHGSVRILYDLAVAVAPIVQAMTFSAYGELLALHNTAGVSLATTSRLSSLGYSGEHFDAAAQQQYLRARFYSPTTGRFNRLDPFAGNMRDPQSLHKRAYVHGDPIQNIDPTGRFSLGGALIAMGGLAIVYAIGYRAPRNPYNLDSNSGWGNGPLRHGEHYIELTFPQQTLSQQSRGAIADQVYGDLANLENFNGGNNEIATRSIRMVQGRRIAWFDTLGILGIAMDIVNTDVAPVQLTTDPDDRQVIADTLGFHMLDGQRRWWVEIRSPTKIRISTEAFERSINQLNSIGAYFAGEEAQLAIWDQYLFNLRDVYQQRYSATAVNFNHRTETLGLWTETPWLPIVPGTNPEPPANGYSVFNPK